MAVSLSLVITQNSQSVANNTSNVTVKVNISWTYGSWNHESPAPSGTLKIDGTSYSFSNTFNDNRTTSGSKTLFTKTVNVSHASDGTKTLACSASFVSGVSSGTVSASANKVLTTIPRKSSLSVSNGTLNTAQTLTVTKQATAFTHTITYKCGTASGTVCTKSSDTSISWTPPASLASQNKTGTSVSVTFTITTYNGSTNVGSSSVSRTFTIPSKSPFKPSCTVSITEATNYAATYGAPLKGVSKLKVTITPTLAYESPIASYSTSIDGSKYTGASFTTGVLKSSGTITASATVKDKRGNSGSGSSSISGVLDYNPPIVDKLTVHRCNEDGSTNDKGEYVKIVISYRVTSLSSKNRCSSYIQYKKSTETTYCDPIDLGYSDTTYTVSDREIIFKADTGSSYDVKLTVSDAVSQNPTTATTSASTAFTLQHWKADGTGMGIGKISELSHVLDVGLQTRHIGGILQPVLEAGSDFNFLITPNTYTLNNANTAGYINCPLTSGTGTLEITSSGPDGQIHQIVTVCHKTDPMIYERFYYGSSWGEWIRTSDYGGVLLWDGGYYMTAGHTATLSELISKQKNGIVLVFSEYVDGESADQSFHCRFIPKMQVAMHPGKAVCVQLSTSNLAYFATKYLYISDDKIVGHENNNATGTGTCGITYTNSRFVLRYVIGV